MGKKTGSFILNENNEVIFYSGHLYEVSGITFDPAQIKNRDVFTILLFHTFIYLIYASYCIILSAKISKMLKNQKIIYLIFSLSLIFSCSVEKPVTSSFIKENESNNEKNTHIYLNFSDSNLELPNTLILERENSIEVINKKGNIQRKIDFDKENNKKSILKSIIKEKSLIIFLENYEKIRIINYDTNKELYVPINKEISHFSISKSKEKMAFYSFKDNILYILDIYGNISRISKIEKDSFYLLYNDGKSILFVKNENNKKVLCTSDLKGNIKELTEIDTLYDINSYFLSQDEKRLAFTYQGDIYTMNIDGSNKIKLTDKNKYSEDIRFYAPQFSLDNKYIFLTKSKGYPITEGYIIKSDSTPIILNESSSSFVGYTDLYRFKPFWIDNETFLFQKLIEWSTKDVIVKIETLGDKFKLNESTDIKIKDTLKIPKDYQLQVVKKSYDSKKIAYTVVNSKYQGTCSLPSYKNSQFKLSYDSMCYSFENPDINNISSFLYISDYDGKNEIKILEDKVDPIYSLTNFSWSSDSRFLFVDYNSTLYVYSVEKNQLFKIDTDDDSFIHNIF